MKKFILNVVGGELEEWGRVSLLLGFGFFVGIFIATYDVGVTTIFLINHDEQTEVPKAFVYSGILGIVTTIVFTYFQRKVSYKILTFFTLLVCVIGIGAISYFLNFHSQDYITYIAFVVLPPVNAIVLLIFWGMFGRVFNVRESKRLTGGIDSGQAIATILAFFSVPFILTFLPKNSYILYISAICIFISFIIAFFIMRKFEFIKATSNRDKYMTGDRKKASLFHNKYIVLMGAFVICSALAATFVEYSYLKVAAEKFPDETELSNFISFFSAIVMIAAFASQTFFNDWMMENYGLKNSLLLLPFILLGFTLFSTLTGNVFGFTGGSDTFIFFFLLVAISKLFVDALRDSLESPALKIFFLPLDPAIRFDIQTKIEGVVVQFGVLIAGGLMIGLNQMPFFTIEYNNYVVILIIGIWVLITYHMHNSYNGELTMVLELHRQSAIREKASGHFFGRLVSEELETENVDKSKHILNLIEKIDHFMFEEKLKNFTKLNGPDAQMFALNKIDQYCVFDAAPEIAHFIDSNSKPEFIQEARRVLRKLKDTEEMASDVMKISLLSTSKNAEDRILAAKLISKNYNEDTLKILIPLFRDYDREVKREALVTSGKLKIQQVLPVVLEHLSMDGYENVAMATLVSYGKEAYHALNVVFYKTGQRNKTMEDIINIFGHIGGEDAKELLLEKIDYPNISIVKEVMYSLSYSGWQADTENAIYVKNALETEVKNTIWNVASLTELKNDDAHYYLRNSLEQDIKLNYEKVYMLLMLLYDNDSVRLVKKNIESGTPDGIGYAMELLDAFLDEELKVKIKRLLDDESNLEKVKKMDFLYPREKLDHVEVLQHLINRDFNAVSRWTKACAIYAYVMRENAELTDDLIAGMFNPDHLISETSAWAVCMLDIDRYNSCKLRLDSDTVRRLDKPVLSAAYGAEHLLKIEKTKYLFDVPMLKGISGIVLSEMIDFTETVSYKSGDVIYNGEDFHSAPIYLVISGSIGIRKDGDIVLSFFEKEMVGEIVTVENDVVDKELLQGDLVALEDCTLFAFDEVEFYELLAYKFDFADHIIDNISEAYDNLQYVES